MKNSHLNRKALYSLFLPFQPAVFLGLLFAAVLPVAVSAAEQLPPPSQPPPAPPFVSARRSPSPPELSPRHHAASVAIPAIKKPQKTLKKYWLQVAQDVQFQIGQLHLLLFDLLQLFSLLSLTFFSRRLSLSLKLFVTQPLLSLPLPPFCLFLLDRHFGQLDNKHKQDTQSFYDSNRSLFAVKKMNFTWSLSFSCRSNSSLCLFSSAFCRSWNSIKVFVP